MSNKRYSPTIRREMILRAAVETARKPGGWARLTRQSIALEADVSEGLVSRYLGDMKDARRAIMREAIRNEHLDIIAASVAARDGYAVKKWLPQSLKQKALSSLY